MQRFKGEKKKVGTQMAPLLKLSFKMKQPERGLSGIVHKPHGSAHLWPFDRNIH